MNSEDQVARAAGAITIPVHSGKILNQAKRNPKIARLDVPLADCSRKFGALRSRGGGNMQWRMGPLDRGRAELEVAVAPEPTNGFLDIATFKDLDQHPDPFLESRLAFRGINS